MSHRRATVSADEDDLAVLADAARRRGLSLALILGEAVADKAAEIRRGRQRRVATFHADASIAIDMDRDEEAPGSTPFR